MTKFSKQDVEAVRLSAERMVQAANESLQIANSSRNLATRASRLNLVRVNLDRLKALSTEYPFLSLTSLQAFERSILKVERETAAMSSNDTDEVKPAEANPVEPAEGFHGARLSSQCATLDIPLEIIPFEKKAGEWIYRDLRFTRPEAAALAYFQDEGYIGTCCEGAAILMLMKCASLNYLTNVNTFGSRADACMRYFESQCWIHSHLMHHITDEIAASTEDLVRSHFREIAAQPNYRAVYPVMDEEALAAIWRAVSPTRWAELAKFVSKNPSYRAGWPDLTLARGDELRFVEVKTTDKLHPSQKITISEVLRPWGAVVSVARIKPLKLHSLSMTP